jgi:protein-histidine N-methyltransferase
MFSGEPSSDRDTHVNLQDYNASVLELITFPNIILAWCTSFAYICCFTYTHKPPDMSPSSAEYRASADPSEAPPADPTVPGELPITPALKSAFAASLVHHRINLAFFSGSWESLTTHLEASGSKYDVVLTSETIYRTEALPALIILMHVACAGLDSVCLVAAKILYFGVGGGVSEFVRALQSKKMAERGSSGKAESVWERSVGVGRKVMRIEWA